MRKIIILFLVFAMLFSLLSCKKEEPVQESLPEKEEASGEKEKQETVILTVEAKDCFDSAGYVELVSGAEKDCDITFAAENSEEVEWSVYVFDEAFADGFRYISQASEPVLVGDGTVSVKAGQFVYVYCSVNAFTADSPEENAKLNITVK